MKSKTLRLPFYFSFLFSFLLLICCSWESHAQDLKKFQGSWQGRTYGSVYDPMFTFTIKPNGVWTDLTFGEAKAINGKYKFNAKTKVLTLFSKAGNKLYDFKLEAATASQKERLVEQLPANETYRALVCYHYKK
jgi:hypothetical protein